MQVRLNMSLEWILADHILVAFDDQRDVPACVLRLVTQQIGEDEVWPLIKRGSDPLIEVKVIHFEVVRAHRGPGIGRRLMEAARDLARSDGRFQLRSRFWYT